MNQQEAAALLAIAAAFDNRKPDPDAATAWSHALWDVRFEDAREAAVQHYRTSSEWLMPKMVLSEVKRLRALRIKEHGDVYVPPEIDPDDTAAYQHYLRTARQAIADGEPLPRPALVAIEGPPEQVARLRALIGTEASEDHNDSEDEA
jgi:hypothetical protein